MLYMIGGAPRVGKTTLARRIMNKKRIPFVSTDVLTHALDAAYPSLRIRSRSWETIPDAFVSYLQKFARYTSQCVGDCVIEGDAFFPSHVALLSRELPIRSCFIGASAIYLEDIKRYSEHDDWVSRLSEAEQRELPNWIETKSAMLSSSCHLYGIPFLDIANSQSQALKTAYDLLFQGDQASGARSAPVNL
jgi:hypothetical protein